MESGGEASPERPRPPIRPPVPALTPLFRSALEGQTWSSPTKTKPTKHNGKRKIALLLMPGSSSSGSLVSQLTSLGFTVTAILKDKEATRPTYSHILRFLEQLTEANLQPQDEVLVYLECEGRLSAHEAAFVFYDNDSLAKDLSFMQVLRSLRSSGADTLTLLVDLRNVSGVVHRRRSFVTQDPSAFARTFSKRVHRLGCVPQVALLLIQAEGMSYKILSQAVQRVYLEQTIGDTTANQEPLWDANLIDTHHLLTRTVEDILRGVCSAYRSVTCGAPHPPQTHSTAMGDFVFDQDDERRRYRAVLRPASSLVHHTSPMEIEGILFADLLSHVRIHHLDKLDCKVEIKVTFPTTNDAGKIANTSAPLEEISDRGMTIQIKDTPQRLQKMMKEGTFEGKEVRWIEQGDWSFDVEGWADLLSAGARRLQSVGSLSSPDSTLVGLTWLPKSRSFVSPRSDASTPQNGPVERKDTTFCEDSLSMANPLIAAIETRNSNNVLAVLRSGVDVNAGRMDMFGETPLHKCAREGLVDIAKILVSQKADVDVASGPALDRPLHVCAYNNQVAVARVLISHGAKINAKNQAGWAPLHECSAKGHSEMADCLLRKGANINVTNHRGWTPLIRAAFYGHSHTVELLLSWGADPGPLRWNDQTWVTIARQRDRDAIYQLLEMATQPDEKDMLENVPAEGEFKENEDTQVNSGDMPVTPELLRTTYRRSFFLREGHSPSSPKRFSVGDAAGAEPPPKVMRGFAPKHRINTISEEEEEEEEEEGEQPSLIMKRFLESDFALSVISEEASNESVTTPRDMQDPDMIRGDGRASGKSAVEKWDHELQEAEKRNRSTGGPEWRLRLEAMCRLAEQETRCRPAKRGCEERITREIPIKKSKPGEDHMKGLLGGFPSPPKITERDQGPSRGRESRETSGSVGPSTSMRMPEWNVFQKFKKSVLTTLTNTPNPPISPFDLDEHEEQGRRWHSRPRRTNSMSSMTSEPESFVERPRTPQSPVPILHDPGVHYPSKVTFQSPSSQVH